MTAFTSDFSWVDNATIRSAKVRKERTSKLLDMFTDTELVALGIDKDLIIKQRTELKNIKNKNFWIFEKTKNKNWFATGGTF